MKQELVDLVLETTKVPCQTSNINKVIDCLRKVFAASKVTFVDRAILCNKNDASYIPVIVHNRIACYYEVLNSNVSLTDEERQFIMQLLSNMHTNLVNYQKIFREANTDKMTGLYNKNYFVGYCRNFDANAVQNLHCLFMDINGLHQINNQFGHGAGDLMLQTVALRLREVFTSPGDNVFRVGGDEFVVISSDQTITDMTCKMTLLKHNLQGDDIDISCGLASAYLDIDLEKLINLADQKMYYDKQEYYERLGSDRYRNR